MRSLKLLLIIALLGVVPPAEAATDDDRAAAQVRVNQGLLHARAGEFTKAIPEFEAALKLYPNAEIMHSLARSYEELKQLAEAHQWFGKALETNPGYLYSADAQERLTNIEASLRQTHGRLLVQTTPANARLTLTTNQKVWSHLTSPLSRWIPEGEVKLEATQEGFQSATVRYSVRAGEEKTVKMTLTPIQLEGYMNVACSVAGAEVLVDGLTMGFTPINTLTLTEGSHVVEVRAGGFVSQTRTVQVLANATSPTVAFQLVPSEDQRLLTKGGKKILATTLLTTGGIALIGAAIINKMYYDDHEHYEERLAVAQEIGDIDGPTAFLEEKNKAEAFWTNTAEPKETWFTVGYVTGGALVVTGTYVLFGLRDKTNKSGEEKATSWHLWPSITPEGVSASATLRF